MIINPKETQFSMHNPFLFISHSLKQVQILFLKQTFELNETFGSLLFFLKHQASEAQWSPQVKHLPSESAGTGT